MYYISNRCEVHFVVVALSKAYDRIITSLICVKNRETDLRGHLVALIDFIVKNTFVYTSYGGHVSGEWNVKNGVRQRGVSSKILIKFYISELSTKYNENIKVEKML